MMKHFFRYATAFVLLACMTRCARASDDWSLQDIALVKDTGEQISQPGYAVTSWHKAVVPGTVLTSLVADGIYPEPLYGENNRPDKIPESLCRTSYWYRASLAVPTGGQYRWLNFEGINYIAHVYVNGHSLGDIRGAFVRGKFDITPFTQAGAQATVAVLIDPPPHPGNPAEQTVALGTGGNGGILAEDGPTFLCSIGWDWIPAIRDRNIGIWQKVTITTTGPVVLEDPLVYSKLPLPAIDSADLTVSTSVHNISDRAFTGSVDGMIENVQFTRSVTIQPHESQLITFTASDTPQLHFNNPRLWWPNGYGKPELYRLRLRFNLSLAARQIDHTPSDEHNVSFGIRQITYSVPGSENLTIVVNGVPIICKGGDWGMDEAMKRIPRQRLEAQIHYHQLANLNMIRNWVGQSTEEDFYDLCDRYGIMLWDEFFQPNPSDGPNPLDATMYIANVREKVLRYRNHPSIALWCGRNEGNPPPGIDSGIAAIMKELEPSRLYQKNSNDGRGVRSGGPYAWRPPVQYYTFPNTESFKTELGSVSIPTLEAIQNMMPEADWNTFNDDWALHDLCRGAQRGDVFPTQIGQRFGMSHDLEGFARNGAVATYEAYRAMYEGRFAKMFAPVTGVLTWMSNPSQNSMVWQLYSHDLEPDAALYAARKACEPLHVMMNQTNGHVMIVNTTPTTRPSLHIHLRELNLDGSPAGEHVYEATAAATATTDLGAIEWPAAISPVHFVKLEMSDAQGAISDNVYWRTTKFIAPASAPALAAAPANAPVAAAITPAPANAPAAPGTSTTTRSATTTRAAAPRPARGRGGPPAAPAEDFTDLQKLPTVHIDVTLQHDGNQFLAVLANHSASVALLTHIQLRDRTGQRILPVYYDDNYITLLPGEIRQVHIDIATPTAKQPLAIAIDGWNVQKETILDNLK